MTTRTPASPDENQAHSSVESVELAQRYGILFTACPLPVWIQETASLRILAANDAVSQRLGYSREELLSLTIPGLSVPGTPGSPAYRRKDGRLVSFESTAHPIRYAGRDAELVIGIDRVAMPAGTHEVRQLNAQLEQRVEERTALLQTALKELEAFSYSVSHDLRSPLRGIDGMVRAVLEDHADSLPPDSRRLLALVRSETRRMSQLIDDLLAFSRAGRQELESEEINMTDLAESAFQTLAESQSGAVPPFTLNPLPPARGDRSMIRQVFANLLHNAVKFSSREPAPRVEVSGWAESDRDVYCVKDNGVGFDQSYAPRLFGVFQRLHSQQEFEGTGVGLALVQRIVLRHGGQVWGAGTVGGGAAFHFALPRTPKEPINRTPDVA